MAYGSEVVSIFDIDHYHKAQGGGGHTYMPLSRSKIAILGYVLFKVMVPLNKFTHERPPPHTHTVAKAPFLRPGFPTINCKLTQWITVLQKLRGTQLVKKLLPLPYGTRRFSTVFTKVATVLYPKPDASSPHLSIPPT
jgi:hypothetical protein